MQETVERIKATVKKLEHLAVILLYFSATVYKENKDRKDLKKIIEPLPEIFKEKLNERAGERGPDEAEEICEFNQLHCSTITRVIWNDLFDKLKDVSEETDEKFRHLKVEIYARYVVDTYLEHCYPYILKIIEINYELETYLDNYSPRILMFIQSAKE